MNSKIVFIGLFVLGVFVSNPATAKSVDVGFLESSGVRKAFQYENGKWRSSLVEISSVEELAKAPLKYSSPRTWTLFFDGKTYGTISTKPYPRYQFYKQNGLQQLTGNLPTLRFRKEEAKFSGWEGKNKRPVLASSESSLKDPNHWKPFDFKKIEGSIAKDLKERLKNKITFCKSESCEDESPGREPRDSEMKPVVGYKDAKGNLLVSVMLAFESSAHAYCETEGDGCAGEGPFWYLKNSSGTFKFLTSAAALIDTADLNSDGSSELVFWLAAYNEDGYELIDGKSLESIKAKWSYH